MKNKQYRFTVFTQDAEIIRRPPPPVPAGGVPVPFPRREFKWRLKMGSIVESGKICKLSIESINCRDRDLLMRTIVQAGPPAVGGIIQPHTTDAMQLVGNAHPFNTQTALGYGNTDEKELYTIRCPQVNSRCLYDTRPVFYGGSPLIYSGALNFQNNNPEKSFCYECDGDLVNNEFTLIIDDNYNNVDATNFSTSIGIKENLQVSITFLIFIDDRDE